MSICMWPRCVMTTKAREEPDASRERAPCKADPKAAPLETADLPRSLPDPGSVQLLVFTPQHKLCRQHHSDFTQHPPALAASPNHLHQRVGIKCSQPRNTNRMNSCMQ